MMLGDDEFVRDVPNFLRISSLILIKITEVFARIEA